MAERIGGLLPLTYLVLDGHFGNAAALKMARACKLHLISKLRSDSALYLPYDGEYAGRGPYLASMATSSIRSASLNAICAKPASTRASKRASISWRHATRHLRNR